MKKVICSLLISNFALLSACASKLNTVSPESVDLSGDWVLNTTYSQEVVMQRANNRSQRTEGGAGTQRGRDGGSGRGGKGRGNRESRASLLDADEQAIKPKKSPSMTAKKMTINQNPDSIGMAYPNELYRDIDWGETEMWDKTIEAGWDKEDKLVIETSSEKHSFTETYQLNDNGRVLTLIIDVNGSQRGGEYRRVFERKAFP